MAETDNDIDIKVGVDGVTQTVAELEKVNTAVSKSAKSTEQMAVAQKKVQEATTKSNVSIGQFGSSLGLAGAALGKVNPAMGQLTSMAGAATGVIQGLTTAGLGPLGIALSAVSLLVGAGASAWSSWKTEQDQARESAQRTVTTLSDLIAKQRELNSVLTLRTRLAQGRGTAEEQTGFVMEAQEYSQTALGRVTGEIGSPERARTEAEARRAQGVLEHRRRLAQQARDRESYEGQNRSAVEAMEQEVRDFGGGGSSARSGSRAGGPQETEQQRLERLMTGATRANPLNSIADLNLGEDDEGANERAKAEVEAAYRKDRVEAELAAEQEISEALNAESEKRIAAAEAESQARVESAQKTAEMISTIGSITSGVYGFIDDAIKKTDESEEERFKREKARIGVEAAINAVVYGASAAAAFATGNIPGGIGFTAAATMSAAAAVKAGIDAGAGPAATGGGGMQRPDSPQNLGGGNGGGNITVLMTGPVLAGTDRAAFGRELNAVISDANNRYGNAA